MEWMLNVERNVGVESEGETAKNGGASDRRDEPTRQRRMKERRIEGKNPTRQRRMKERRIKGETANASDPPKRQRRKNGRRIEGGDSEGRRIHQRDSERGTVTKPQHNSHVKGPHNLQRHTKVAWDAPD